jgi:nitrile hydratase subunit alpha
MCRGRDASTDFPSANVGPLNGAKVVAKAWTDPQYRRWLLDDGTAAIRELGYIGVQTEHVVVVENTATSHHVVVCTLCSCYPWQLLGLPPSWYKDPAYRARIVREPRKVLCEMGLEPATMWRSPSTTPAARSGGSCCQSARPAPRACRRNNSCR